MGLTSAIQSVTGAKTGSGGILATGKQLADASGQKRDKDGNLIKKDDDALTAAGKETTTAPKKPQGTPSEQAIASAAAKKAAEIATKVPGTETTPKTTIGVTDLIAADNTAKAADAKALADQAQAQAQAQTQNSPWNNLGAQGNNPTFNSSNDRVLAMGGKSLQEKFDISKPENLIGGFKSPEPASGSTGADAQPQGAPGGGIGGGPVSNSGNTYVNSFNGGGNGNLIGGPITVTPQQMPKPGALDVAGSSDSVTQVAVQQTTNNKQPTTN